MAFNSFKKKVQEEIVAPALSRVSPIKVGIIVNARYSKDTSKDLFNSGGQAEIDVVITELGTEVNIPIKGIPVVKTPGVQQSLPTIGMYAVIAFVDGNSALPICIGFLTSPVSNEVIDDNTSPSIPPKYIGR